MPYRILSRALWSLYGQCYSLTQIIDWIDIPQPPLAVPRKMRNVFETLGGEGAQPNFAYGISPVWVQFRVWSLGFRVLSLGLRGLRNFMALGVKGQGD